MRKIISIISIISVMMFFSCSKDDNNSNTPTKGSRTVLMYVCAGNNLLPFLDQNTNNDYDEMVKGAKQLRDDQYLLAFIDRSRYSHVAPKIMRLSKDSAYVVKQYEEDFYCTSAEKMEEVMKWVVENYPSDSYGLTFWGHGSGWLFQKDTVTVTQTSSSSKPRKAYGSDMSKWINLPALAKAIEEGMPKLDFIFFDCCNMQSAEVAYELRNCTDYIIGSPAEIPGVGAPYDYVEKDFFLAKDNIGKAIIDDYTTYANITDADGVPLSVIKTSAMENLANATQYALTKFMPQCPEEAKLDSCIYYYQINRTYGLECMYDIRNFMRINLSAEDFSAWDKSLTEAVPYRTYPVSKGNKDKWQTIFNLDFNSFRLNDDTYGGMSIYVPSSRYSETQNEGLLNTNASIKLTGWGKIMDWSRFGW